MLMVAVTGIVYSKNHLGAGSQAATMTGKERDTASPTNDEMKMMEFSEMLFRKADRLL